MPTCCQGKTLLPSWRRAPPPFLPCQSLILGVSRPFTSTVAAEPAPRRLQDPLQGSLPHAVAMDDGPATYERDVDGVNANGGGWTSKAHCQAILAAGMNGRTFCWGHPRCP